MQRVGNSPCHNQIVKSRDKKDTKMADQPRTSLQKWQDGINKAVSDPQWSRYDCGGDPSYSKKIDYALGLVRQDKAAVCTS